MSIKNFLINNKSDFFLSPTYLVHIPSKRLDLTLNLVSLLKPKHLIVLLTPEIKKVFQKQYSKKIENQQDTKVIQLSINSPRKINFKSDAESIEKIIKKYLTDETLIDITGGNKLYSIILYDIAARYKIKSLYLYTYEFSTEKGLIASPGNEKLYILDPKLKKSNDIIIDSSFNFFITIKDKSLYVRFNINHKSYQKVIPIDIVQFSFLDSEDVFQFIDFFYDRIFNRIFNQELNSHLKKYKIIKLFFDKNSYFIPIDSYLHLKLNIFTVRDFIYENIDIKKEIKYKNNILILVAPLNSLEEKNFSREADIIGRMFEDINFSVNYKTIYDKNDFRKLLQEKWKIIHYIGHTDIDNKGSYMKLKQSNIYASDIKKVRADFIFFNSCNSAAAVKEDVKKSFPYIFLQNNVDVFMGNLLKIKSEFAEKFAVEFYSHIIRSESIGIGFTETLNKFKKNKYIRASYLLYGNYNKILVR